MGGAAKMKRILAVALFVLAAGGILSAVAAQEVTEQEGCEAPAAADQQKPDDQQEPNVQEEMPPELRAVLDKLDEANKTLKDLRANLVYRREIPLLDEFDECKGALEFKKPHLIHMKLGKPLEEEMYSDGKCWWLISHRDKQVEIYEIVTTETPEDPKEETPQEPTEGTPPDPKEGTPPAPRVDARAAEASFFDFGLGRSSEKLLRDYRIELLGQEVEKDEDEDKEPLTCYRLRFTPRQEAGPARFCKIEVELADDLWLPRLIVLHESDGNIVHKLQLKDVKLNTGLKPKRFVYKRPKGYVEVRP